MDKRWREHFWLAFLKVSAKRGRAYKPDISGLLCRTLTSLKGRLEVKRIFLFRNRSHQQFSPKFILTSACHLIKICGEARPNHRVFVAFEMLALLVWEEISVLDPWLFSLVPQSIVDLVHTSLFQIGSVYSLCVVIGNTCHLWGFSYWATFLVDKGNEMASLKVCNLDVLSDHKYEYALGKRI